MTRKTTLGTRTEFPASMADLGSVFRSGFDYFNPLSLCLVSDKTLQLVETPIAYPIVHSLSPAYFPNAFEVFHHNLVSVETGNNAFADIMVYPLHPTSFSSRQLPEKPLAGTSAFALKFGTQMLEFSLDLFDFGGIEKPAVACDSKVIHSEINAKNNILRSVINGINILRKSEQKESSAFIVHSQDTFVNIPREIFFVTGGDIEPEFLPFLEKTQDKSIPFEISTSWEIVSDGSTADKGFGFCFFDCSAGLLDARNSKLCRKRFPQMAVNKRMELDIVLDFAFPRLVNAELQSSGVGFDSCNDFGSCSNLDFGCCFYLHATYSPSNIYKPGVALCQVASGGEKGSHSKLWGIRPRKK